jgi:hypothetical protein
MGPSSLAGFYILGVGSSFVLDEIVSYKKTFYFSYTHYHLVIGEDGIDAIRAHLVGTSKETGDCFLFATTLRIVLGFRVCGSVHPQTFK